MLNLFYSDLFYNQRQLTESFLDQRQMINVNLKVAGISKTYSYFFATNLYKKELIKDINLLFSKYFFSPSKILVLIKIRLN